MQPTRQELLIPLLQMILLPDPIPFVRFLSRKVEVNVVNLCLLIWQAVKELRILKAIIVKEGCKVPKLIKGIFGFI